MGNLQHHLDFENPSESSLAGMGKGPGGWYFHGGVQVTEDVSKFGKHSLWFSEPTGNLSKFNQTDTRLCKAGQGFTFSLFFKNINTVKTHRTILQLYRENDPDGRASHLVYVSPYDEIGGSIESERNWSDIDGTKKVTPVGTFDPASLGLLDDEWHHMAVVGKDNETTIYFDGSPVYTYGVNPAAEEDNYLVVIGNRRDHHGDVGEYSSSQLVEYIDYFKFYDVVFSEKEIIGLMNEQPGISRLRLIS